MLPLILLSHGSRHADAQAGIDALVRAVVGELGCEVVDAHLDFSERTLTTVAKRYDRAVVVPLLFSSGYHARADVPAEVAAAQEETGCELLLADTLGVGPEIAELLARGTPEGKNLVLYPVGSSRMQARADYTTLQDTLARITGRSVEVIPATGEGNGLGQLGDRSVHVMPLFVTDGLLLDKARAQLNESSTISAPLTAALAPVVSSRYRQAVSS